MYAISVIELFCKIYFFGNKFVIEEKKLFCLKKYSRSFFASSS